MDESQCASNCLLISRFSLRFFKRNRDEYVVKGVDIATIFILSNQIKDVQWKRLNIIHLKRCN